MRKRELNETDVSAQEHHCGVDFHLSKAMRSIDWSSLLKACLRTSLPSISFPAVGWKSVNLNE